MRAIVVVSLVAVTLNVSAQDIDADRRVRQSTDVGWLEHIAATPGAAEALKTVVAHKTLRSAAYVRLGEIGSTAALAAARRVETAARKWALLPSTISLNLLPHPSPHYGDSVRRRPFAQYTAPDGVTYALIELSRLGGLDAFLTASKNPNDVAAWSAPRLLPNRATQGMADASLTMSGPGVLALDFNLPANPAIAPILRPGGRAQAQDPKPQRWEIVLADVLKDTDGDGWSDIEEKRLYLDPANVDSDRDGINDGSDVCPTHAPSPFEADDEEAAILRKVFFAGFGILYSQDLYVVRGNSRPLQLWGSRAPVLYGVDAANWYREWNRTPWQLRWSVKSVVRDDRNIRTALVEFGDSGAGYTATLKHLDGDWYVVKIVMNWIS